MRQEKKKERKKGKPRDVSGGPVVKTSSSNNAGGMVLIPGQRPMMPHDLQSKTQSKTEAIL